VSRDAARQGVARYFGGTTWDDQARIYRPTPLAASGLAGVRPYWTPRFEDHDYRETLPDGSAMGAVMCVHLADNQRTRIAAGIKKDPYSVELWVFAYAMPAQQEDLQAFTDALLTAIVGRLEADPTLGGVFIQAGESGLAGTSAIATRTGLPAAVGGGQVRQECIVTFEAQFYPSVTFA